MEWNPAPELQPDFDELRDLILGAIARENAQVPGPIAGTLSAGLDSSVLSVASRHQPGFRAYSIEVPGLDNEKEEIDETVRVTGIRHTYVPSAFTLDDLLDMVAECGEPIRELKSISTMLDCARQAKRDGMRSFLLGLGPDMIFAGAQMLVLPYIHALVQRRRFTEIRRSLPRLARYVGTSQMGLLIRYLGARRAGAIHMRGKPSGYLKPEYARSLPIERSLDPKAFMARMLSIVAISSSVRAMERLTGLTFVAPLYSRRIAEYTLSRDPVWLMRDGASKAMMRAALETVLPRHITHADVKKKVPHRSVAQIVYCKDAEEIIAGSPVLRRMLSEDPVPLFRRGAAADAEFWVRCVQVARLEQLCR